MLNTDDVDVSAALDDFLALAPNDGVVTVKQPPNQDHTGWGQQYQDQPTEHDVIMLVLPPNSPQSSVNQAEFEFYGQIQPDDKFGFAPTPIEDINTGEAVTIQEATSDDEIGSRIIYKGRTYRIAGPLWDNSIEGSGYESFLLKHVKT